MTIEETLQIALDAHKGQKDLDGKPAILHPIAVGLMGSNDADRFSARCGRGHGLDD